MSSGEEVDMSTVGDMNKQQIELQRRLLAKTKTEKTNALLKKSKHTC